MPIPTLPSLQLKGSEMIECAFCNAEGIQWDTDLEMALCGQHYAEMNGTIADIELNEVFE